MQPLDNLSALLKQLAPLTEYGRPGTRDVEQRKFQEALAQAQSELAQLKIQMQLAKAPKVSALVIGANCLSEDDCIRQGLNFASYEKGVADAIEAFESFSKPTSPDEWPDVIKLDEKEIWDSMARLYDDPDERILGWLNDLAVAQEVMSAMAAKARVIKAAKTNPQASPEGKTV